ncbi:creatininase family protein [Acetobacter farinalis]|uniref:Creatininase family protein n=1 Tax=Acetobacter farinalis TaxID=1260984 RepID=A0ABT3Q5P3_9PROT|nr:creatininase family protein [Acetobacter farinalis]MCX2560598.1 creatininase family protein [Acetobacter farinalis]
MGGLLHTPAHAQEAGETARAADAVLFEKHTWTEIQSGVAAGVTTIIIPVGGTEQSGPYIAVGKHNERAAWLAEQIAQKAGKTLVAPVVSYVPEGGTAPRSSHMRFPGTITVPPDVFEKLLVSAGESFQVQGFRLIVLLGDHGGYQKYLEKVADELNRTWRGNGAQALYVSGFYTVIAHQYADWLKQQGYGKDVGQHADISDTSLMLAVDPSMVRQDALRHAGAPSAQEGIYGGDPRRASAALGQAGLAMQIDAAVQAIRSARGQ